MAEVTMTVSQGNHSWQVRLASTGVIIGRSDECDIVIDSRHVSRQHARISETSAGEWMVEDLGSRNGTFVNGERVESSPISRSDVIEIGPASLSFSTLTEQATVHSIDEPNIIVEDFGTEVFYDKPKLENCEREPCPERLAQVRRRLLALTNRNQLYHEVCRLLAHGPKTAAAVFQVPNAALPSSGPPVVMACCFGSGPEEASARSRVGRCPTHLAFRVSHRLLEAVCKDGYPLMTKSIFSCDTKVTLSLIDEHSPRAVMCAPLGSTGQTIDLLYVDLPIDERCQPGSEEMFAFVQAVAKLASQRNDAISGACG